jgi:hypothetical protein
MYAMWKQNTVQVIPIVISSTGVIPKSKETTCIQIQSNAKSVILGTCSIVRDFLNYK